jgi:hypothetical protein
VTVFLVKHSDMISEFNANRESFLEKTNNRKYRTRASQAKSTQVVDFKAEIKQ